MCLLERSCPRRALKILRCSLRKTWWCHQCTRSRVLRKLRGWLCYVPRGDAAVHSLRQTKEMSEYRLLLGIRDRLLDLGDVVKRSRVRFQKKNLEVDLTSTKTNRAYLELQPNFCPQPSQPRNMDRQAIFGDTLPVGGISSTSPYLFDLFDDGQPEYIDYSSYAPTIDPASLHFEPSALTVFQDQPGIHLNQGTCGVPDLFDLLRDDQSPITVEDRYSIPGTMSGYDSTIPHAPPSSLSWTPGQYSEALSSCPSLEIHQNRADSPLSTNFFDATGQHTGVTEEIRKPREILPCPAERKLRGEEMSCPLTDMNGKSPRKKNRPCDLTKEQRKTTKPVACRLCPKTFAFNKDRKRHYVVSHKDYAVSEGLSVELIPCPTPGCERTYTRSDNVTRHLKTSGCGKQ